MRGDEQRAVPAPEMLLEPLERVEVEVVRRLVEQNRSGSAMTSRASAALVCSPPDSADGGSATPAGEPETGQRLSTRWSRV